MDEALNGPDLPLPPSLLRLNRTSEHTTVSPSIASGEARTADSGLTRATFGD